MKFHKFIPFTKVEEQGDGTLLAWGRATAQSPDLDREVCDYETTKPFYKALADQFFKATSAVAGMDTSLFPVREMHQLIAAGCGKSMEFKDDERAIDIGVHVVAPDSVQKVKSGVLIGFSHGGDYVKTWPDPENKGCTRYTAKIGEISLVDSPCLPEALISSIAEKSFQLIDPQGSVRLVKMQTKPNTLAKLDVGDVTRIAKAVAAQLASKNGGRKAHLLDAAKAKGWTAQQAAENLKKAVEYLQAAVDERPLAKGMYSVKEMACVLDTLAWLQQSAAYERESEGDATSQPEQLAELLQEAIACFIAMVEEETGELAAFAAALSSKGATPMKVRTSEEVQKMAQGDLAKAFLELQTEAAGILEKAKGAHTHLVALHKAITDHHGAMAAAHGAHHSGMIKAHTDHMAAAHAHIAKAFKAMGHDAPGATGAHGGAAADTGGEDDAEKARKAAAAAGNAPTGFVKASEVETMIAKALQDREPGRVRGSLVPRPGEKVNAATPGSAELNKAAATGGPVEQSEAVLAETGF